MISVLNRLQLLSGSNKYLFLSLFAIGLLACSAGKKGTVLHNRTTIPNLPADTLHTDTQGKLKQEKEIKEMHGEAIPAFVNDFHIALFLPFSLNKDAIPHTREYAIREGVLDYYQGILLALDSLEREGIKLTLHVQDTRKDSLTTVKLLANPEMKEMDLLIGPLDQPSFKVVADFALENDIPVIAPFSYPETSVLPNPMAFYVSPDLPAYGKEIAAYLKTKEGKINVLYISDGSKTDKAVYSRLNSSLKDSDIKIEKRKWVADANFRPLLKKDSVLNIVIIPSDNEQTVKAATWAYRSKDPEVSDDDYLVEMIGLDTWLGFRDPNFDLWETTRLLVYTAYYESKTDSNFLNFRNLYRERFTLPPSNISLKGFDQMLFFGHSLLAFGKYFPRYIQETEFEGTGMNFYWYFNGTNVVNEAIKKIRFENYQFNLED